MTYTTGEQLAAAIDWRVAGSPDPMPAAAADLSPDAWVVLDKGMDEIRQILAKKLSNDH